MNAAEVAQFIETTLAALPERMTGNEANEIVSRKLRDLCASRRDEIVECLRNFLSFRPHGRQRVPEDVVKEARIWLALDVAEHLKIQEVEPDIKELCRDIRKGLIFQPAHASMVGRYLDRMKSP